MGRGGIRLLLLVGASALITHPACAQLPMPDTLNAQYAALQREGLRAEPPAADAGPVAPEPAPSGAPSVGLAHRVVDAAAAYEGWMRRAAAIGADFDGPAGVLAALHTSAGYQALQFEQGEIAYVALLALQDAEFVRGVGAWAGGEEARQLTIARLVADPSIILGAPGSGAAGASAAEVLRRGGQAVLAAGGRVKQAAYSVQRQPWSQSSAVEPEARLSQVKAQSAELFRAEADDMTRLLQSTTPGVPAARDPDPATRVSITPIVERGLALAALALLGEAGEDRAERLDTVLNEPQAADCTKMAKLNLFQCLAVAGPEYEHVFCMGQHAIMETAQCVVRAAGAPAISVAGAAAPATPRGPTSVMIPIAVVGPVIASR